MSLFDVGFDDTRRRRGRKWTRYGPDVIPMWIADSDFHVAPEIKDAVIEAAQEEDLGYGDDLEVRKMMAEKIEKRNGFGVDPESIYVTPGVLPAMWLTCKYACGPGDEVVVTDPMYYPFFEAIKAVEARPVYWKLDGEKGYRFDVDSLNEVISPKTKLIFVCNPHNPTGRVMTKEELSGLADLAIDHDLMVMVDELWEDVIYDGRRHISLASLSHEISDRTMTAFGFSKAYSVAGLQIGYLASSNKDMMERVKRIGRGILRGTSTLSLAASKVMLSDALTFYVKSALEHLHRVRDLTAHLLNEIEGISCNDVEATYLTFPKIGKKSSASQSMAEYLLEKARIAVEEGSRFGPSGGGHVRINFGTGQAILTEAMSRMRKALDELE